MYAIMKTGGKQYRVSKGDVVDIEKIDADDGEVVRIRDVLMVGGAKTAIGSPKVDDAYVDVVVHRILGEKVINFVRRRRKSSSKRTKGHRQQLTRARVVDIYAPGISDPDTALDSESEVTS